MHKATETCIFLTSHEISVGVIGLHNDNAKGGNVVSGHSVTAAAWLNVCFGGYGYKNLNFYSYLTTGLICFKFKMREVA